MFQLIINQDQSNRNFYFTLFISHVSLDKKINYYPFNSYLKIIKDWLNWWFFQEKGTVDVLKMWKIKCFWQVMREYKEDRVWSDNQSSSPDDSKYTSQTSEASTIYNEGMPIMHFFGLIFVRAEKLEVKKCNMIHWNIKTFFCFCLYVFVVCLFACLFMCLFKCV